MEELLKKTGYQLKGFKRGQKVSGTVVDVTGRTVYIDVGGKAEAVIGDLEYDLAKDYFRNLKPGDKVEGVVLVPENDAGQVILSLRKAAIDTRWNAMEKAMTEESEVTVKGKEVTKGGILVDADGLFGFIPSSQVGHEFEGNLAAMVAKVIRAKVIEVDRTQNRLVLSEKAVSEAAEIEKRKRAMELVDVGKEYDSTVVGVVPFGVFAEIEVGKAKEKQVLEGLIHISELSWEKIDDVNKSVHVGDKIKVRVIGRDEENGKLALSVKRLSDDPWSVVDKKYKTDSKHEGEVTKVAPYGVLVRMERGIEGLIHASKMPGDVTFTEGQKVEVFVESVDLEKRRLSLGVVLKSKPVGYK
jgi:ribosomal protein S1